MTTTLVLHQDAIAARDCDTLLLLGRRDRLLAPENAAHIPACLPRATFEEMVRSTEPGDNGRLAITHTGSLPRRIAVGVLPELCSRHNTPTRAWAIPGLVRAATGRGNLSVVALLEEDRYAAATAMAVGRAMPSYAATSRVPERRQQLVLVGQRGEALSVAGLTAAVEAVRKAGAWVDQPPNVLGPDALVAAARAVAALHPGTSAMVLRGQELWDQGLHGLFSVGMAAVQSPALVVLDHAPQGATETHAWVGKGITYDTGGLSIKTKTGMPGMKSDMGGAAAALAAFDAAVLMGFKQRLTLVLCIAENAVGPASLRPDDILRMYSGRTVEVNNTDAEGRLVLADGLAWVIAHRQPSVLIDLATLTGAQGVATGKRHAGIVSNDDALESQATTAGKLTGETVFPLPYLPELLRQEFSSTVADMRNSVKNRDNAQSSCAAQFLANHLGSYDGPWLHVDLASPAVDAGRGTGFGVGLLLGLAGLIS